MKNEEVDVIDEFNKHVNEGLGVIALSAVVIAVLFFFANGYEILGGEPIWVVFIVVFHSILLYMFYRAGKLRSPTLAVIALIILAIEFGLAVILGFQASTYNPGGSNAGIGLAAIGLWNTFKGIRFMVKYSHPIS